MTECNKSMNEQIPSFSLTRQNRELKEELMEALSAVVDSGSFILGRNVEALEEVVAGYCGARYGIGVANGSDALYLAMMACDIGPGDEVITTPFTFFATGGAVARLGAKPVFADIDPASWNIDPAQIESKITPRTRAILPVHLYGCPAEMDPILKLAAAYNLKVIEDAAQALGSEYKEKRVGALGDAGCISFFPTKNLGAFGDGGMVVTNDPDLAGRVRQLRVHGARVKYHHEMPGCNSRLDELQAAVLLVKFQHLERWTGRRQEIAALYSRCLAESTGNCCGLQLPAAPAAARHVYHQYTVQTDNRDGLQKYLQANRISTTVYYPLPLHLQIAFASLGYKEGQFPVAEKACREVLSLPMFPELEVLEIKRVAETVAEYFLDRGCCR